MGLLHEAETWLSEQLGEAAGVLVAYSRGDEVWEFLATPGEALFAVSAPEGKARVIRGEGDWIFTVADAVLAGLTLPPQKGDRITATLAGEEVTFQTGTPTGEEFWHYTDATRLAIRVHMRRVAT